MTILKITPILAALALAACGGTSTPVTTSSAPAVASQMVGQDIGPLLNADRNARGLGSLRLNPLLSKAAALHAADMNANNFFSHSGSNGSKISQRVSAQGYCWRAVAENIEQGSKSEAEVHNRWMGSPGHFANNMNAKVTEYGLGKSDDYWVLLLAKPC